MRLDTFGSRGCVDLTDIIYLTDAAWGRAFLQLMEVHHFSSCWCCDGHGGGTHWATDHGYWGTQLLQDVEVL